MQGLRTFIIAAMAVAATAVSFAQNQGSSAARPGRDQPPPKPAVQVPAQPAPAPAQPAPPKAQPAPPPAQPAQAPAGVTAGVPPPPGYLIGPEDVLIVLFREEKDMSGEVVVRPDGKISLPLVNDIQAAGLTPDQLRTNLQETATKFLQEPTVTVVVKTINSRKVFITGMVAKPGPYPLTAPTSVLQLIAMAGGLNEYAEREHIVILRTENGRQTSYRFNYKEVAQQKKLNQNMELRAGDTGTGSVTSLPIFTVVLVLVVATGVGAQDAPPQPKQPQQPQEPAERKLSTDPASALARGDWNVTLSGFGGYERSKYDGTPSLDDPASNGPSNLSSPAGGGSARVSKLVKTRHDSTFSFGGGATSEYYRAIGHAYTDANAYASQATMIGRHSTVAAAENMSYAPYYSIGLFPGIGTYEGTALTAPTVPTFDSATKLAPVFRYGAAGQLSHPFTDQTTFTASYSIQLFNAESLVDSVTHEVSGRLSHTVSKFFGVHAGYGYTTATFRGIPGGTGFHNIDVGVDLHKALSLSRRTTFSFSTGSTIVRRDVGSGSSGAQTEFRLLGGADLDHYIGRTWSARVSYRRDWQMLEGSLVPFFSDAVTAGIGGNAARTVTVGLSTSYLMGTMMGSVGGGHDQALTGNGWLQYEIGRALATYVQYGYYLHRFESSGAGLNLPARFDRNAVRVGLTLVLPPGR